ncbi:DUF421 domain-containing protein [Notoacmeibacter sp. MSK16QG-6]|uniref:DUF421 domain-containing protein n=1 Tax=Notoacmeibacter sp. MSK16QG-6 TaxID=2957982 RepID=UPI0020A198F2|nr:YetF domain-containing protein [Notoacmeibacter sp. MSK16QG-6]MCP1200865.1 DUF421 domain-containing protein [Notoacmeibacter sp. MSK16QG-6]
MFVSDPLVDAIFRGVILSIIGMLWVIALVRINGLRSFSKITSFDFVMTVACGSLLAGCAQADSWAKLAQNMAAFVGLFAIQHLLARLQYRSSRFAKLIGNTPLILMRDGKIDHDALRIARVTEPDLRAKLREANALEKDQVRAVVLETTGDISVLHGESMDMLLLKGLR